jgi:hypothetical protein
LIPKKTHPLEGEDGGDENSKDRKKKPKYSKEGGKDKNGGGYRDLGAMVRKGSQ